MTATPAGDATILHASMSVPHDDPILAGHYPGFPIVPGMLLIERVRALVGDRSGAPRPVLTAIDRCRFHSAVRPGDELELRVELTGPADGPRRCSAVFHRDGAAVATARMRFEPTEER